ncbi:uncharacterized protein CANTADRAFT_295474 [Suhomyces tanzawaensis NRRL Y-17324]|uniref:GATA-type domain-containing protein n=1 Tax=Suhomyces tanzawaensis NRRL Y-17324 TaxID=984487 RepID=A0A1E4SFA0_9ASCO|nr:uncharacterized protein CANTADRAFT_295474 [Suhomyces tanzawaensis NRRL Y-17324]ODV78082.1 hypothetical protein CANTADRAFT_295474 [Suhomyces tanzawaensis NRRL Y-17324]
MTKINECTAHAVSKERLPSIAELIQVFRTDDLAKVSKDPRHQTTPNYERNKRFNEVKDGPSQDYLELCPKKKPSLLELKDIKPVQNFMDSFESLARLLNTYVQHTQNGNEVSGIKTTNGEKVQSFPVELMNLELIQMLLELQKIKHYQRVQRRSSRLEHRGRVDNSNKEQRSYLGEVLLLQVNAQTSKDKVNAEQGGLNLGLSLKHAINCHHCGSNSTPEWRRGPTGMRTLCNACGLFYSKLCKRYNSATANRIMRERKCSGDIQNRKMSL